MKYFIHTYGCKMNVHESEKISAMLIGAGHEKAASQTDADVLVFNTCCIRNSAELKVISHIGETIRLKKIVCVVGCLAQRDAARLKKMFPHIRVILGTHNIDRLPEAISKGKTFIEVANERTSIDEVVRASGDCINITYGCENYCSYCIVPYVRGKLISRDSAIIIQEFESMVAKGSGKLMWLLGQNVNSYVCPRTNIDFPELLERLCKIKGDFKINFLSSHPKDFSKKLVDVIAKNTKVDRNIHLPMQSGCDRILTAMNRKYSVAEYKEKIDILRGQVPDVKITTDIICGFPGETEEEYLETANVLRGIKFNAAFIFVYSRRSGTVADKMEGQIDTKTKKRRTTELVRLMREINEEVNK